ncbi:hypothetical protein BST25_20305 [Mycobacterium heidelbergense]|uniref:PE-PGRS family protein n=2 Tax=Mycobacterium heidelbergense TaxID=53376 RepID=A0A1X0DCN4_MYCHE|nr:hypothetical protein BST25_20305 [Mycobacterium heidelbergense]
MVVDLAARPQITAGVALTSAAVLAAGPLAQHLPDLHLTQQLRTVSVSGIQLTDAAEGIVDLFSGVENELASLASGASAAAAPAATVGAFVNPITTWTNVLQTAANNIGVLGQQWLANPFPVASQVVLNELNYGNIFAKAISSTGGQFWNILASTGSTGLAQTMFTAGTSLAAGNLSGAIAAWTNLEATVLVQAGLQFFPVLAVPGDIASNFGNLVTEAGSQVLLLDSVLPLVDYVGEAVPTALGDTAQGVINAVQAGDPVGVLSAIVNAPANLTGDFLNGFTPLVGTAFSRGLIGPTNGSLLYDFGVTVPLLLSQSIGASKKAGTNTSSVIPFALNSFGRTVQTDLTTLWNTATADLGQIFSQTFPSLGGLATALQGVPAALAPLGAIVGNATGQIGRY